MASSKTETRVWAASSLRAVLDEADLYEVAGNTPFLLNDPQHWWWVEAGRIELFVVELSEGRPEGARQHFSSVEAGSILSGLPCSQGKTGTALLAVPHVNTRVRCLPVQKLHELSQKAAHEIVSPIDAWVNALSSGLAGLVSTKPVIHETVAAGATVRVAANKRLAAADGVVWLELPKPTVLFLDTQELPASYGTSLMPVNTDSWVQCGEPLELTARDTAGLLEEGEIWEGLANLHEILLPAVQTNLMLSSLDEHNRLYQRAAAAQHDWNRSLDELRGVLDSGHAERTQTGAGQPLLVRALEAIAKAEGFDVRVPPRPTPTDENPRVALSAILHASGLRARQVALKPGWEQHDTPAMLGLANGDGRPLAILPNGGKRVRVLDPKHGRIVEGAQALALLSQEAYAITAPLPFTAVSWPDLLRYTAKRGGRELAAVLFAALTGGLLGMAIPIGASYLIDTVIPSHDVSLLVQLGLILSILGMTSFVMSYVGSVAFSRFQARAGAALQAAIIDRLLRLPVGFFRKYSAGDLALRANAVTQIDQLLSGSVAHAVQGALFAFFSFTLLLYYDWRMGLVAVLISLIYVLFFLFSIWMQLRRQRHVARLDGQLHGLALQMVTGIEKIRLAASETRAFSRWAGLYARYRKQDGAAARYANRVDVLNALLGLLPLAVFFLIFGYGRDAQALDAFAIGGLAAFLAAFDRFQGSVSQITHTAAALLAVQPLLERAKPILDATPEVSEGRDDPGELAGTVEFSGVSFRYSDEGPLVLDNVSLTAKAGEFIAIVGPSGCGKSTLLRLLLGFEVPNGGRVLLDGKDISELDLPAVRRQMGVVLQNSRPLAGSLYENIVGASNRGLSDAWEAARKAGLAEEIQQMPMGMHTNLTQSGSLSGGQMQRLLIARAIVDQPRILILDEATSALDNRVQAEITNNLDRLSITRIVVAHRLSTVAKANRIYVMEQGRIVEQGSFEELLKRDGAFTRLAAAQLV